MTLTGGSGFTVPFASDNYQFFFSFPQAVRLVGLSTLFNNFAAFTPSVGTDFRPYVAVATSAAGTFNFSIEPLSITYSTTGFVPGISNPTSTILRGVNNLVNVLIPAGTNMTIVGGWANLGTSTQALQQFIYMSGSVFFTLAN
ncbi:hypothetical protein JCM19046_3409 [Bacillus sp. JCM 19046]|nr:hypothetical protein JCM19045_904 [Bacillus sp. JCM 19045]GAF18808.1 hypothetical protein JCM19046_3409 [Bacillus sp. JCM 19046]